MIRTMRNVLLLIGVLMLPCVSSAAGLGELKVVSALGQPLKAEIGLVSLKEGEAQSLEAHIAPPDSFRQAGVPYNPILSSVQVGIVLDPDGKRYIRLSSPQIVNDPFLDVLIRLSWGSGEIEREYTMLFDPVEFAKTPSVSPPVAISEKRLAPAEPSPPQMPGKYGPVKRGETLSGIALATKPEGVTLEQMLVALYRSNDDAFIGKNMNRLEAGKVLRVPDSGEIAAVERQEAAKVVKVQALDWNAYRQRLASAVAERREGLKRSVSGKITASVEDKGTAVSAQPEEVLKLSKGEAGTATAKEEEKAAQIRTLNEASERILMLEKNIQEMRKLLALKNQALALAKSAPVAVPAATPSGDILDSPILWVAGAFVLGGLAGGAGVLLSRRKKAEEEKPVSMMRREKRVEPAIGKPEPKAAEEEFAQAEAHDPLEEARLYFSYRRYAQAEEIIHEALQANPANFEAHLLLLKVLAAAGDKDRLELSARRLQAAQPSAEIWGRAMEIGFAADPRNPLYGGAVKEQEVEPVAIDLAEPSRESLDFDLDFEAETGAQGVDLNLEEGAPEEARVDFEIPEEEPVNLEEEAAEEAPADFDLSAMLEEPAAEEGAEAAEEAPVDFDLAAMLEEPAAEEGAEAAEEAPVDFDLGAMLEEPAAEEGAEAAEGADVDLSSMIEALPQEAASEEGSAEIPERAKEAEAFDISEIPSLVETSAKAMKPEMPDVDLHLGEAPAEVAKPRDAGWYEVATKLDLAKVYQEMGDQEGAREILEEVLNEGDSDQKATARAMLGGLSNS